MTVSALVISLEGKKMDKFSVTKPEDYFEQLYTKANDLYLRWVREYNSNLSAIEKGKGERYEVLLTVESFLSAAASMKMEMEDLLVKLFGLTPQKIDLMPKKTKAGMN